MHDLKFVNFLIDHRFCTEKYINFILEIKGKVMEDSFKLALKNIARYGDTDIFPYPVEKEILRL
ncbi:hypothetical protein M902_2600 [Bacteriovorax sp. BAL6_X]|nr:hypothetical protein M902_2600 [Bacteriovorax sp. BAL6_X]